MNRVHPNIQNTFDAQGCVRAGFVPKIRMIKSYVRSATSPRDAFWSFILACRLKRKTGLSVAAALHARR